MWRMFGHADEGDDVILASCQEVCARCLVSDECLEDSFAMPEVMQQYGLWGGLLWDERRRLARRRAYAVWDNAGGPSENH